MEKQTTLILFTPLSSLITSACHIVTGTGTFCCVRISTLAYLPEQNLISLMDLPVFLTAMVIQFRILHTTLMESTT